MSAESNPMLTTATSSHTHILGIAYAQTQTNRPYEEGKYIPSIAVPLTAVHSFTNAQIIILASLLLLLHMSLFI